MTRLSRSRGNGGFTLVEILVGIGIFSLVALALTTILLSSTRLGSRTSRRAEVQGGSRQTLSLISTELRQAGADPSIPQAGIVGIVAADSVSIHIRADLNGDGVMQTAEPSEEVTYTWADSTNTITRNTGSGAVPVLSNVTALSFRYFDASGNALTPLPLSAANAALVTSIEVSFTAEEGDSRPVTLATRVNLRNR
jgi:prepilin-type N-terminal cleavage/methylation domain-containing protein